jgi:hypothetical protein
VTSTVFSVKRSARSEARSLGFSFDFGVHHLIVKLWRSARSSQAAILASWSIDEMTSSEPAGNLKAKDRLRNSCVVDDPSTRKHQHGP